MSAAAQIIGVGGSVIKAIRAESGASVEIQRQEQTPTSAENREIYLTGKAECVQAAEKLIWCAPAGCEHAWAACLHAHERASLHILRRKHVDGDDAAASELRAAAGDLPAQELAASKAAPLVRCSV